MRTVHFVTSNEGKAAEVAEILAPFGITVKRIAAAKPEDHDKRIEDIAREAALMLAKKYKKTIIVEDTGLFLRAYPDFPGVNTHFIARTIGMEGVLRLLSGKNRAATFKTAVGYATPKGTSAVFVGTCPGRIASRLRGKAHPKLPYDTIFIPSGSTRTFSEDMDAKAKVSHRVRAFKKLGRFLRK